MKAFLMHSKSKKPKFIFTDQYPTIAKVLAKVMLEMLQRLSTWHIMQSDYEEAWDKMKKLGIKCFKLIRLRVCLDTTYFVETENLLLKVL